MTNEEIVIEAACDALGYNYNTWIGLHSRDKDSLVYTQVTNWCKGADWQLKRMYDYMEEYSDYCLMVSCEKEFKIPLSPKDWFEQLFNTETK